MCLLLIIELDSKEVADLFLNKEATKLRLLGKIEVFEQCKNLEHFKSL